MAGIFGRIFGSDAAISATISSVTKGLDALVYTDEEKAGDAAKERTEARQMVVGWMKATQGQNLSRRFLALSITGVWLSQYVGAMLLNLASVWVNDPSKLTESAQVIGNASQQMNGAVMLILAFYFSAPFMGKIANSALSKFGGTKK